MGVDLQGELWWARRGSREGRQASTHRASAANACEYSISNMEFERVGLAIICPVRLYPLCVFIITSIRVVVRAPTFIHK